MTTTVNKPGWGWDDEPAKTTSPAKTSPAKKAGWGWDEEEPVKAPEPPRKKIKTSELPLSSATRTAIESLLHKFKKKGGYDAIRKQVWGQLEGSVSSYTTPPSIALIQLFRAHSEPASQHST